MAKVRVHNFTVTLDGFGAGRNQSRDEPLGEGFERMHNWMFATRFGRRMLGEEGGSTGVDEDFAAAGDENVGATIMGRNMFGPIRGPWGAEEWRGWWGDEPPYHHPVFVLTHHAHDPIRMQGGTTFHFVTDGIERALERAVEAAAGKDVRIGGGVSTVQQYLRARLVDSLHVAIVPVLLGAGERLFEGLDDVAGEYECVELVSSDAVTHARLQRIQGE